MNILICASFPNKKAKTIIFNNQNNVARNEAKWCYINTQWDQVDPEDDANAR